MYGMAMEALNLDQRLTEDIAAGAGGDRMGGVHGPAAEAAAEAAAEGMLQDLLTYNNCAPTPTLSLPDSQQIGKGVCRLFGEHLRHGTHADGCSETSNAQKLSSARSQPPTP